MIPNWRKKALVAVCLALIFLLFNMCLAVFAPVFSLEVRKIHPAQDVKSGLAIGLIFSMPTIAAVGFMPLIGRELPRTGAKHMFVSGAFLYSSLMILISFVSQLYDWTTFLGFCYAIRLCSGIGMAMILVSTFAFVAGTFPDKVATMTGATEFFRGLGFLLGPSLGGVLYQYGGFKVAFMTEGGMLLLAMIAVQFILPATPVSSKAEDSFSIKTLLCQPRVILVLASNFMGSVGVSFFDPTLSPLLHEDFHLTPSQIGAIIPLSGTLYMLTVPVVGYLSEKYFDKPLIPLGCFLWGFGLGLMGLQTVLGVKRNLAMVLAGFAITGVAAAPFGALVPADILNTMRKKGYDDTPALHSAIGSLNGAAVSLGLIIGPLVGGGLTYHFTFASAAALLGSLIVALGFVVTAQTIGEWYFEKRACNSMSTHQTDRTPLTDVVASK